MNKLKYIFSAMLISASLGSIFTGCQDNEIYDVNSPADLDEQITQAAANIAERERLAAEAAAAQRNAVLAKLQDDVYQVGNTENGGAFWQTFSKSYTLDASEDAFMIKFKNFTSGVNSYHNFGLVITNDVEHSFDNGSTYPAGAGYAEYVVLRADNFKNWAWGNENGKGWNTENDSGKEQKARLNANYDASEAEDKKFSEQMEGADCEVFVGRAGDTLNIQYTIKTWAGETLTKKFFIKQEGVSNQAVRFFLITEKGHLVVYKASTTANETPEWSNEVIFTDEAKIDPRWKIDELGAVGSLNIGNYTEVMQVLSEENIADKTIDQIVKKYIFDKKTSTAQILYKNGAVMNCEASKLSFFTSDEFTEPGTKTIYASYPTKSGAQEITITTSFTVTVTPAITSIKIEAASTTYYYAPGTTTPPTKDDIDATSFIKAVIGTTSIADIPISAEDYTIEITEPTTMTDDIIIKVTYKDFSASLDVTLEMADGWNGKIVGRGKFVTDETFGIVFENDGSAQRTSYFLMPEGTIPNCSESKAMTISFWVNGNGKAAMYAPLFSAYGAAPIDNQNTMPMFIIQGRGLLQTNCAGWIDFDGATNDKGTNLENIEYLNDNEWHLVTVTITDTHAEFIVDKTVVNAWTYDGTDGKNATGFLTEGYSQLTYICLGGNQAWNWVDNDSGYKYAKFKIYDRVISSDEIAERIANKE